MLYPMRDSHDYHHDPRSALQIDDKSSGQYSKSTSQSFDLSHFNSTSIPRPTPKKLRILMLHGYTQTGPFFAHKTAFLTTHILKTLHSDATTTPPPEISFLYPTGPINLHDWFEKSANSSPTSSYAPSSPTERSPKDSEGEAHAWWTNLDNTNLYTGLPQTLRYLRDYLTQHGPVDGIISFSQGAILAPVLAALCEARSDPARLAALAAQGFPVSLDMLPPADQPPLKFVVSMSGFVATEEFYGGCYEPRIKAPTLCVLGEMDTMIPERGPVELSKAFVEGTVLKHSGGHFVPRDSRLMEAVVGLIRRTCGFETGAPLGGERFDVEGYLRCQRKRSLPFGSLSSGAGTPPLLSYSDAESDEDLKTNSSGCSSDDGNGVGRALGKTYRRRPMLVYGQWRTAVRWAQK